MRIIPLTKGKSAVVDDADFEWLSQWKWSASFDGSKKWYASRHVRVGLIFKTVYMHRIIASPPDGMEVDHVNGDGLDNRRVNLRVCTHTENTQNRGAARVNKTGYKGVVAMKGKFRAEIHNKRMGHKYLGYFDTPEEAARAYDEAAKQCYGEFAKLNFPENP